MASFDWVHRDWEVSNGGKPLKIEAAPNAAFPITSEGIEVERWWDPERGTYFAFGKAQFFGISVAPHPDVEMVEAGGAHVGVDELLVPFIQYLWDRSVRTVGSCQGDAAAGNPVTGGMPGRWGYIKVFHEDAERAAPHIHGFGFDNMRASSGGLRQHEGVFDTWRFTGLTS